MAMANDSANETGRGSISMHAGCRVCGVESVSQQYEKLTREIDTHLVSKFDMILSYKIFISICYLVFL